MRRFIVSLLAVFFAFAAGACYWVRGTSYEGSTQSFLMDTGEETLKAALKFDTKAMGRELEMKNWGAVAVVRRSDYAVGLMCDGDTKQAVQILEKLEAEKPGDYETAANLGTAYELSGDDEAALKWIKEGVRRNPESHEGTEWLHVKILEAKLAAKKDTNYFNQHTVLDLQPETADSGLVVDGKKLDFFHVRMALEYQLAERLKFVRTRDPAVAALLFDFAAVEARSKTLESTKALLQMAVDFGFPAEKIRPLVESYDQRIALAKRNDARHAAMVTIVVGLSAVVFFVAILKIGAWAFRSRNVKGNEAV